MVFAQFSAIIVSGINQIKYADTKDYTPKCGKESKGGKTKRVKTGLNKKLLIAL